MNDKYDAAKKSGAQAAFERHVQRAQQAHQESEREWLKGMTDGLAKCKNEDELQEFANKYRPISGPPNRKTEFDRAVNDRRKGFEKEARLRGVWASPGPHKPVFDKAVAAVKDGFSDNHEDFEVLRAFAQQVSQLSTPAEMEALARKTKKTLEILGPEKIFNPKLRKKVSSDDEQTRRELLSRKIDEVVTARRQWLGVGEKEFDKIWKGVPESQKAFIAEMRMLSSRYILGEEVSLFEASSYNRKTPGQAQLDARIDATYKLLDRSRVQIRERPQKFRPSH